MSTLHSDENANNFDSWLSIIIKILFIILLIIGVGYRERDEMIHADNLVMSDG